MLYGEKTKRLNEQVKRNPNRFPADFMFQLTRVELEKLRTDIVNSSNWMSQNTTSNLPDNKGDTNWISQIATSNSTIMGFRKRPYAFTSNGIAMLSSVLRSQTANEVNIRIMRAFTAIPGYHLLCTKKEGVLTPNHRSTFVSFHKSIGLYMKHFRIKQSISS